MVAATTYVVQLVVVADSGHNAAPTTTTTPNAAAAASALVLHLVPSHATTVLHEPTAAADDMTVYINDHLIILCRTI